MFMFAWKRYIPIGEMKIHSRMPRPASKPSPDPAIPLAAFMRLKAL